MRVIHPFATCPHHFAERLQPNLDCPTCLALALAELQAENAQLRAGTAAIDAAAVDAGPSARSLNPSQISDEEISRRLRPLAEKIGALVESELGGSHLVGLVVQPWAHRPSDVGQPRGFQYISNAPRSFMRRTGRTDCDDRRAPAHEKATQAEQKDSDSERLGARRSKL
jgi:hypothetical protein